MSKVKNLFNEINRKKKRKGSLPAEASNTEQPKEPKKAIDLSKIPNGDYNLKVNGGIFHKEDNIGVVLVNLSFVHPDLKHMGFMIDIFRMKFGVIETPKNKIIKLY